MSTTEQIKELRDQTGAGIIDVKKALDESGGDYEKALDELRKRGAAVAAKKAGRNAGEGIVTSYIHMNKIGVLLELNCETDFVALTDEFQGMAKDLAMQVASMSPLYVNAEDVPTEVIDKEREIFLAQIEGDKPEDVQEKIINGKVEKYLDSACLMRQKFFKDEDKTITDVINEAVGKLGEKIQVSRFVRYSLEDGTKQNCAC